LYHDNHAAYHSGAGSSVGNKVRRTYFRTKLVEQRRAIMDAWAEFCGG
jgi:hypothetical protein